MTSASVAPMVPDSGAAHVVSDAYRVLVAEDDPDMRSVLVDAMRKDGHEVHAVADGTALLIALAQPGNFNYSSVDLVLTDVRMPICSGLKALETVRQLRVDVPFVLLTAFDDIDTRATATVLGATVVTKPCSMADLRRLVSDTLYDKRPRRSSMR